MPSVGYEGGRDSASGRSIIWDVLDAYPNRTVLHAFDVCESPGGHDRAVLIDKMPDRKAAPASPARPAGGQNWK